MMDGYDLLTGELIIPIWSDFWDDLPWPELPGFAKFRMAYQAGQDFMAWFADRRAAGQEDFGVLTARELKDRMGDIEGFWQNGEIDNGTYIQICEGFIDGRINVANLGGGRHGTRSGKNMWVDQDWVDLAREYDDWNGVLGTIIHEASHVEGMVYGYSRGTTFQRGWHNAMRWLQKANPYGWEGGTTVKPSNPIEAHLWNDFSGWISAPESERYLWEHYRERGYDYKDFE